jgi:hypothetical protein
MASLPKFFKKWNLKLIDFVSKNWDISLKRAQTVKKLYFGPNPNVGLPESSDPSRGLICHHDFRGIFSGYDTYCWCEISEVLSMNQGRDSLRVVSYIYNSSFEQPIELEKGVGHI